MAHHVWDAHREEDVAPPQRRDYRDGLNASPSYGDFGSTYDTSRADLAAARARADESHQSRLHSIKQTAAREKMVLLDRIEELSVALRAQSKECADRSEEIDEYHRVFGTLGDFSARQVGLREEVVSLRDNLRQWQEKEQHARAEVKRLQRVIESLRRGGGHDSAESRLADLEERIAAAHVQRGSVEQQLKDLDELAVARRTHNGLAHKKKVAPLQDDANLAEWQLRGKRADLERQLKSYTDTVKQLQDAADSMRSLAQSERWTDIGSTNRKCPGCSEAQWVSPFCPATGHRHLGYERSPAPSARRADSSAASPVTPGARGPVAATNAASSPTNQEAGAEDDPEPQFVPPSAEELKARIDGAIRANEWMKLVEVGTFRVTYRNERTGETVSDLAEHFVEASRREHRVRHDDWASRKNEREARSMQAKQRAAEVDERKRLAAEVEAAKAARGAEAENVHRGFGAQVQTLVAKLNTMTAENKKLRSLLAQTAKSGVVGWHPPAPKAAPTRADGVKAEEDRMARDQRSPGREVVALHDEDDVQTETKLLRLQSETSALSQRCAALILELCKRDERIEELQGLVVNLQQVNDPGAPSAEYQLRSELADVRAKLVIQERHGMALEDEVRRLRATGAA